MAKQLDPKSKAATILLRNHTRTGYCAGPEFPGATIRQAIDKLYSLGYLADEGEKMVVTSTGRDYLNANHLLIPS
jgi:hypothetical protein